MHTLTPSKCINEAPCWERWDHFNHPSFRFGIMPWYAAFDKEYGTAGLEVPNDGVFTGVQLCILYVTIFNQALVRIRGEMSRHISSNRHALGCCQSKS